MRCNKEGSGVSWFATFFVSTNSEVCKYLLVYSLRIFLIDLVEFTLSGLVND